MKRRAYFFRLFSSETRIRRVVAVGAASELGNWQPDLAPQLVQESPNWYCMSVSVPPETYLSGVEFKYAYQNHGDSAWHWEALENRVLAPQFIEHTYYVVHSFNVPESETAFCKLVSFNLRYDNPGDGKHAWPHRRATVVGYLQTLSCDVICVQEALMHMVSELRLGLGASWSHYAVGRDDGLSSGESSAILYRNDRWEHVLSDTFWLSEQPETPGSRSWGSACVRICSWVLLRHRGSGKLAAFFNTHLDHISPLAQENGLRLINSKIHQLCSSGIPFALAGDFNMVPTDSTMKILLTPSAALSSPLFPCPMVWAPQHCSDPFIALVTTRHPPTFTGFHGDDSAVIDYIFVRPSVTVLSYRVLPNRVSATMLSDHAPVEAQLIL